MPLSNAGRGLIVKALLGEEFTPFSSSNAFLGVGNSSLEFDCGQDKLQGDLVCFAPMVEGYPKRDKDNPYTLVFRSVFLPNQANFDWCEWGIFNKGITLPYNGYDREVKSFVRPVVSKVVLEVDREEAVSGSNNLTSMEPGDITPVSYIKNKTVSDGYCNGVMLVRQVDGIGTKVRGSKWIFSVYINFESC